MHHEITIMPAEIRQAWARIQRGDNPLSDRQDGAGVTGHIKSGHYRGSKVDRWIGCSGDQMQDWLTNGYFVDGTDLDLKAGQNEISTPMVDLVEEDGDLILSQALGGEDLIYAQWQPTDAPRGLTIRANWGMIATTPAKVLGEYFAWILKVIDAAERRGIAPDVELVDTTVSGFVRSRDQMTVRIPLVKAGEIVDAIAWRAFLTPGGFRTLGFVAMGLAADRVKRSLTDGMGRPPQRDWKVDLKDDVLTIGCPMDARHFPEDAMNRLLEAAYAGA